ncbi:MAG: CPBP family intramembrane glutamic endopeptidase, partial [Bacteroidota bacterium]
PIILVEWTLFTFFILRFGGQLSIQKWLQPARGPVLWSILAVLVGFLPITVFLSFYETLAPWTVWVPWLLLALLNPWLEEFYWRGLLLDFTSSWKPFWAILYVSLFFSFNHAVFGLYSEVNQGPEVITVTLILGMIWGWTYHKTGSLRWCLLGHFLVDFFNLSVPAFLDLFEKTPIW